VETYAPGATVRSLDDWLDRVTPWLVNCHISNAAGLLGEGLPYGEGHFDLDALLPRLAARFAELTTAEWLGRLRGRVPCAPVNTIAQALADEQVAARDMIIEVKHPRFGVLREVGTPVKTDGAAPNLSPAPALGQHTDEILGTLLHYDAGRIAALRASGALG
jgi:crotonobetainyl-CoA:carnitine CoA-transferase CaiB-like acyl-CoA transferase